MAGREERRKRGEERQREEGYLTTMRWWPERTRQRSETASLGEAGIDGGEVAGLLSWWTWGLLSWWTWGGSEAPSLRWLQGSKSLVGF